MFKKFILFIFLLFVSYNFSYADYYDWFLKCSWDKNSENTLSWTIINNSCEDISIKYSLSLKTKLNIKKVLKNINSLDNLKKIEFVKKIKAKQKNYEKDTFPYDFFDLVINNISYKDNKITILEWWNIFDVDKTLTDRWLIQTGSYITYVRNKEKITALSKFYPFLDNQNTLEWYLFPDTYEIDVDNFKINIFVTKQLDTFEIKVYNELFLNKTFSWVTLSWTIEQLNYDNREVEKIINLASIVEKEERNSTEKPIVAWILKKRLEEWWQMWADITTCYPYELTSNECKIVISKYIWEKSDYNTRFIKWLPPTPISNPSYDTINATVNYQETEYYFYLHDVTTWKIYYAITNEEHNKNRELYIK